MLTTSTYLSHNICHGICDTQWELEQGKVLTAPPNVLIHQDPIKSPLLLKAVTVPSKSHLANTL
ncbi:uncharacterized protein PHALS_13042 [Plasmopara halstedii]|uniref:Uncharacterized protein n=1 Tax=Plasmopara halstedii TaxID=4781 RepID=A0A0P1AP57_PLAHL|nr:uncharacterized protein PHALS_13042 [Plasmopara halstedii]CEG42796.1 hypothetical protein PHALS_13042 [Plasmopara halstedii]|eukprot:XP_024579165.1 hypothetical protein PHALS_13042 [Plasmopara halstedii]